MAEERKAAAKSYKTPKGFFRLSGILNYIAPKAPSKPKAKDRKLYRYSGDGSAPASPITSPKKKERPGGDQRYRYSDELLSPPAAAKPPAKKKADQSYRLSDELLSPPACVKSPARKADQRYRLSDELLSPPAASQRKKGDKHYRHSNEPLSPLAPSGLLSPLSPGGKTKGAETAIKRHDARTERKVAERATAQPKPKADRGADQNRRVNQKPDALEAVEDFRSPVNLSQHRVATQQFTTLTDMTGIVSPPSKPGQRQQNKPTWQPRAPNAAIANMWLPQMLPVYQAAQRQREQQGQQRKVPPAAAATWSNTCWAVIFLVIIAAVMGTLSLVGTLHIGEPLSTTDSDTETDEYAWDRQNMYPGSSKHQPRQTAKTTPKVVIEKLPSSHVCVYRVSAEGRRVLPSVSPYGVSTLPLYSCNMIVYCCASLSGQYTPEPRTNEKDNFERLSNVTTAKRPWQQVKVLIGNGVDQPDRFKLLLENDTVAAKLARATASWCKKLGYSGVFIYWPRGHVFTWNATVASLIKLKRLFQTHQLTVGTVLSQPVDYGLVDDLERLADALGDTSILLRPPLYKKSDFFPKTFSYYTGQRLKSLATMASSVRSASSRRSLCLMVPANALAFRVDDPQSAALDVLDDEVSNGPAPATITSPSGQRSFYEACAATSKMSSVRGVSYYVIARGNGLWLSYTTRFRLGTFLDDLKGHGFSCAGVWNSEMDDFPNLCDSGPYPLLMAAAHEFFAEAKRPGSA